MKIVVGQRVRISGAYTLSNDRTGALGTVVEVDRERHPDGEIRFYICWDRSPEVGQYWSDYWIKKGRIEMVAPEPANEWLDRYEVE